MKLLTEQTYFFPKRPSKSRRTFAIVKKTIPPAGKPRHTNIVSPELTKINELLTSGALDQEQAEKQVQALLETLRGPRARAVTSTGNLQVFDKYWTDRYAQRRRLKDPATMKGDYLRAIKALGPHLSLTASTQEQIQSHLDRNYRGNKHARVVQRLNEILKWANRGFRLEKDRVPDPEIKYLSLLELTKVATKIQPPSLRSLIWVLFSTGSRLGEAFALTEDSYHPQRGLVHILAQRRLNWTKDDTKRGRHPWAPVIPEGDAHLKEWVSLPSEEKRALRLKKARDVLRPICRELFPKSPEKWISYHDLRHSYAVHLARKGFRISEIAKALGDSEDTTRRYYAGFVATGEEADEMSAKLRK